MFRTIQTNCYQAWEDKTTQVIDNSDFRQGSMRHFMHCCSCPRKAVNNNITIGFKKGHFASEGLGLRMCFNFHDGNKHATGLSFMQARPYVVPNIAKLRRRTAKIPPSVKGIYNHGTIAIN
jgi:hypothetical protein